MNIHNFPRSLCPDLRASASHNKYDDNYLIAVFEFFMIVFDWILKSNLLSGLVYASVAWDEQLEPGN
jgi:hypothetical protein